MGQLTPITVPEGPRQLGEARTIPMATALPMVRNKAQVGGRRARRTASSPRGSSRAACKSAPLKKCTGKNSARFKTDRMCPVIHRIWTLHHRKVICLTLRAFFVEKHAAIEMMLRSVAILLRACSDTAYVRIVAPLEWVGRACASA